MHPFIYEASLMEFSSLDDHTLSERIDEINETQIQANEKTTEKIEKATTIPKDENTDLHVSNLNELDPQLMEEQHGIQNQMELENEQHQELMDGSELFKQYVTDLLDALQTQQITDIEM